MTTQLRNRIRTKFANLTFGATTLGVGVLLVGLGAGVNAGPAWSQAQATVPASVPATRDAGTLSHDCTDVTIDYADEAGLTRAERIARMDRAFQRSLGRFEECQSERAATGGGGGTAGGAGTGAGTGDGDGKGELSGTEAAGTDAGGAESSGAETSTAASDIFGPDAPENAPTQESSSTVASDVAGDAPTVTASTTPDAAESPENQAESPDSDEPVREAVRTQGNGKVPEDIPPADNDSVLEAQIRQAAIEETDPELKKRLWEEYRRYKGLPLLK